MPKGVYIDRKRHRHMEGRRKRKTLLALWCLSKGCSSPDTECPRSLFLAQLRRYSLKREKKNIWVRLSFLGRGFVEAVKCPSSFLFFRLFHCYQRCSAFTLTTD